MNSSYSVSDSSNKGLVVEIQSHLSSGLPTIQIIGAVGKSLDESKDRIRSAFASCGIEMPRKKITINISPSDIPKNGAHFDSAIAISILRAARQVKNKDKCILLGEIGLDGTIRPVRGVIGKIIAGKEAGITRFVIPSGNRSQALLIPDIEVYCPSDLKTLKKAFESIEINYTSSDGGSPIDIKTSTSHIDISEIVGQQEAKRALSIAAAGNHNILLSGPPGVGKSMLAKALIGIMPPLTRDDVITITHLHSLVGNDSSKLIFQRPLRSPHHSSSDIAIIGGGQTPKPGEVTLSHKGILFLDELPEFKRSTIESLRQPLEDKEVTISRAKDTAKYPADFLLVSTKNPCPCGYFGSSKPCICSPLDIDRYQKKLSGPLLDRIDLHVTVDSVDHEALLKIQNTNSSECSLEIQKKIIAAAQLQAKRFNKIGARNGNMNNKQLKQKSLLSTEAKKLLDTAAQKLDLSARVYMKTVKIARTIADLDDSVTVEKSHIGEALRYRPITIN